MQQALDYAELLDIPFAYSSNGDGFLNTTAREAVARVNERFPCTKFPTPGELWARYRERQRASLRRRALLLSRTLTMTVLGKTPRYYQLNAINRTVQAIAQGEDRTLLVMATGTGKTYTPSWRVDRRATVHKLHY